MPDLSRLREIVRGSAGARAQVRELVYEPLDRPSSRREISELASAVGGNVVATDAGACLVVDRTYPADWSHGTSRVADWLAVDPRALEVLARARHAREDGWLPDPPAFIDIETTGLSGGAGTCAFLVGCASFEPDGFRIRQFFLPGFGGERALLAAVAEWADSRGTIVTYNGKTFDVPVMETRWLFHRLDPALDGKLHLDMLHPARCLWRSRAGATPPRAAWQGGWERIEDPTSCSLVALERALLGVWRSGDVPGFEIPSRYFTFLRTGDATPLLQVLEHNRVDLLSLAALTTRAATLVRDGERAARDARECLALGRLYERRGMAGAAMRCFARAAGDAAMAAVGADGFAFNDADAGTRAESLCHLARHLRRARRPAEAADAWQRVLGLGRSVGPARREAIEALAIHHEHRLRALESARALALRALAHESDSSRRQAVRHRLARLDRKLARRRADRSSEKPLLDRA